LQLAKSFCPEPWLWYASNIEDSRNLDVLGFTPWIPTQRFLPPCLKLHLRDLNRISDDLPLIFFPAPEQVQGSWRTLDFQFEDRAVVVAVDPSPFGFLRYFHPLCLTQTFESPCDFIRHTDQRISLLLCVRDEL
jgi:hypothetical protein